MQDLKSYWYRFSVPNPSSEQLRPRLQTEGSARRPFVTARRPDRRDACAVVFFSDKKKLNLTRDVIRPALQHDPIKSGGVCRGIEEAPGNIAL